jgi:hypothetical protein
VIIKPHIYVNLINVMPSKKGKKNAKKQAQPKNVTSSMVRAPAPSLSGQLLMGSGAKANNARFAGKRAVSVRDTELIGDLNGHTGIANTRIMLNPGHPITFPTSSHRNQLYQKYRPRSFRLTYTPAVSVFATAGTQGTVIISYVSDISMSGPSTSAQVFAFHEKAFGQVSESISLEVANQWEGCTYFTADTYSTAGETQLYHCGMFFVTVIGSANTSKIGTLEISYDFDLLDFVNNSLFNDLIPYDYNRFQFSCPNIDNSAIDSTWTDLTGITQNSGHYYDIPIVAGTTLTFPVGTFNLNFYAQFGGLSVDNTLVGWGLAIYTGGAEYLANLNLGGSAGNVWGMGWSPISLIYTMTITTPQSFTFRWYKKTLTAGTTVDLRNIYIDVERIG